MPIQRPLINNIFYHTSVQTATRDSQELLSVTVVKGHDLSKEDLVEQVQKELETLCGITQTEFIKLYHIPFALPQTQDLQYEMAPTSTKLKSTIFVAGDYLLNGSLNAAMISGERAAQGVIESLEEGLIVEDFTSEYIN